LRKSIIDGLKDWECEKVEFDGRSW